MTTFSLRKSKQEHCERMIWQPKAGQRVRLNYKNKAMPYQGKTGTVSVCTVGRGGGPVNVLVRLDNGTQVVVPRGQLNIAGGEQ